MRLDVVGHLARDAVAGGAPRIGGAPWHAGRALRALGLEAKLTAKCGAAEAAGFRAQLETLGLPFELVVGGETTAFSFDYDEDGTRSMTVDAVGEPWRADELRLEGVEWVHVAPLLRGEIDLDAIPADARILLDGQGLARVPEPGPLRLDADFDRDVLRRVSILKLAAEEARALGVVDVPELLVTDGVRGATVCGEHIPAKPVPSDPTGAGDMFAAAYLAARAAGRAPVEAARRAAALVSELLR
jgi:sugar/nucleoside kinase (ribokinase family)